MWQILTGLGVPADYTPEDPYDIKGKTPMINAMEVEWWKMPPEQAKQVIVNAFRATMLSPRMNLKSNAILYQSLMDIPAEESDPDVFEQRIRALKSKWDLAGQTEMGQDPSETIDPNGILPGKFMPGFWGNIRRLAALGSHVDEIYQAAMKDIGHGGTGELFRNRILDLGIPGVQAKVASFAWLALAPNTSELATIDVHMMRHLNEEAESPRNTKHYLELEDRLRNERDQTYGTEVPLAHYQWGVWDARRTPGFHQDHTPLKAYQPTPFKDVAWSGQTRPPRPQILPPVSPEQQSLLSRWSFIRLSAGYTIQGKVVAGAPNTNAQGIAVRPDRQSQEEIMEIINNLPTHRDDAQKQRKVIPEWALNRGGKVGAIISVEWELDPNEEQAEPEEYFNSLPPSEVEVPESVILDAQLEDDNSLVTEWLSDQYGWLVRDWTYLRHSRTADVKPGPGGVGVTYGGAVICVSEWVDVDDNWLLEHPACRGIVAQKGGAASHGVVVARQRNIAIVVDVPEASKIETGDNLQVMSANAIIYVNGGTTEEFGEAETAQVPIIRFVWSKGTGLTAAVPQDNPEGGVLHKNMIMQQYRAGQWDRVDNALGVIYADGRVQMLGQPSDEGAMMQWLNTIHSIKSVEKGFEL